MTKLASIEPVSHLFASFAKPATVYPVQSIRTNRVLVNCGRLVNCAAVTHLRMSLFLLPQLCRVSQPLRCPPHRHSGSRRTTMNSVPRFSPVTPLPRQNSFSFHTSRLLNISIAPHFFPRELRRRGRLLRPAVLRMEHGRRPPAATPIVLLVCPRPEAVTAWCHRQGISTGGPHPAPTGGFIQPASAKPG